MQHTQDSDCIDHIDPETNLCTVCHVEHNDPCVDCGQRAYHKPDCPRMDPEDNRVFGSQTF